MSKSEISLWPRKIFIYWDNIAIMYSVDGSHDSLLGGKGRKSADWRLPCTVA